MAKENAAVKNKFGVEKLYSALGQELEKAKEK